MTIPLFRKLERHVLMRFIKAVLFALVAFSVIFILIDMVENLDDFIDQNVPIHIIASYYAYFLPRIFGLMVPVAMLLACLMVVGKMSAVNELTVIKCSGVSLYRFMLPFVIAGMAVSGGMILFDGYGVPRINALRVSLEREYLKKNLIQGGRYNLFFQEYDSRIVSLEYYDAASAFARRVSVQKFAANDPTVMVERIDADRMHWDEHARKWTLFKCLKRTFHTDSTLPPSKRERIEKRDSLAVGPLALTPEIIIRRQQKPEEMELGEFYSYIQRQKITGSDVARLEVDYHGKIAFSFASLVVVFFGVPFASVKRRSGVAVQFGISIFICFTYLVFQKISQVFGYNGSLDPLFAAWLPNVLFLLTGIFVTLRVPK